ncbi:MAG: hypothetical protein HRT44_06915, partial [Bdellovibrionales bacterium]|nr:methylmalonyl-CoA mutase family protein [Bdellovibrionales bacterium]NQZ18969.1 hypothetical protein [Bdellovibrionales bacterium]
MSLYSEWLNLSEEVMLKAGVNKEGTTDYSLNRAPVYFSNLSGESSYPQSHNNFLNIVPFNESLLGDEFTQKEQAAVVMKPDQWSDVQDIQSIFFQPSMNLSAAHKKALSQKEKSVDLGLDPYSLCLWKGELGQMDNDLLASIENRENLKVFRLSSMAYDLSGATPQQQLAILLASTHQLVKDYESLWSVDEILSKVSFELSMSNHVFINMSALKAYRLLMKKFCESLGANEGDITLNAAPSPRYLATREPW